MTCHTNLFDFFFTEPVATPLQSSPLVVSRGAAIKKIIILALLIIQTCYLPDVREPGRYYLQSRRDRSFIGI